MNAVKRVFSLKRSNQTQDKDLENQRTVHQPDRSPQSTPASAVSSPSQPKVQFQDIFYNPEYEEGVARTGVTINVGGLDEDEEDEANDEVFVGGGG